MCDALKLEVCVLDLGHHVARFRGLPFVPPREHLPKVVGRRMSETLDSIRQTNARLDEKHSRNGATSFRTKAARYSSYDVFVHNAEKRKR